MKRTLVYALTLVMLLQSTSYADFNDLPDPGGGDTGNPQAGGDLPPAPPISDESQALAGSLAISGISRRPGGSIYTARLHKPVPLIRLDVRVTNNKVKFYSVMAIIEGGERVEVSQFSNTSVLEAGALLSSQNLNIDKKITQIELVMESFGGEADIILTALSNSEVPKLLLKVETPQAPPSAPSPGPFPAPPPGPEPTPEPNPEPTPPAGQEPDENGDVRVGDTVLYNNQSVGKVVQLSGDQSALVLFENNVREEISIYRLEKSARCVEDFCEGANVHYEGKLAQILRVFPSGWAYLSLKSGARVVVDMFYISEPLSCLGKNRFCIGDEILYNSRYEGIVEAIYAEDHVSIRLVGQDTTMTVRAKQLAKSILCTNGSVKFCVGDGALIQNTEARVLGLYSNGMAKVLLENQNRTIWVDQKNLAKQVRCLKNICVGQKVRYGNRQAIVKEIFSTGTARVTIGILGRDYLVRVDSLRPY